MNTDTGGTEKPRSGSDEDSRIGGNNQKKVIVVALVLAAVWAVLQFSVFGVIVYAIYVAIVIAIVIFPLWWMLSKNGWVLAIIALPLLFGPMAEEAWITYRFEMLCQEAGVHVQRKLAVEGYVDMTGGGVSTPGVINHPQAIASYDKDGFRFYERLIGYDPAARPLRISHVEKDEHKQWRVTILDQPIARYQHGYVHSPPEAPIGWRLEQIEMRIVDRESEEVIARELVFKRRRGVIEGSWIGLVGSGVSMCSRPLDDLERKTPVGYLPHHTFTPVTGE